LKPFDIATVCGKLRNVRLSTFVLVLFAGAGVLPWFVYLFLTSAPAQFDSNFAAIVGLVLRSLVVVGTGLFLVYQLRRKEQLQIKLTAAIEAAKAASRAKSDLLANTSHELRTPLNAIIGFSEAIKGGMFGPLSARYQEYAGHIHSSGAHLLNLINELLDLSKLEAGQFTLSEEDVDLTIAIEESMRLVESLAETHKVTLAAQLPADLPLLRADDRRLRQIIINLLSNAVKFTPEGGNVSIAVTLAKDGVHIAVRDTGIGMTDAQITTALELFGQVDSHIARKHQGSGLGLPLAKQLAERHGGKLVIESKANSGTIVTVSLPPDRLIVQPVAVKKAG
jgi:signal transduction histidine kinase